MGIFSRGDTATDVLRRKLLENAWYPFEPHDDGRMLELRIRYRVLPVAAAGLLVSLLAVLLVLLLGLTDQFYFVLAIAGVLVSGVTIYWYKDIRVYRVYPRDNRYTFQLGANRPLIVDGPLHNIYLRLERRVGFSGKAHYFLTLNGYHIDKVILTGSITSVLIDEMRELAAMMGSKLQINVFDVANVSKHHIVIHFRPSEDGESSNSDAHDLPPRLERAEQVRLRQRPQPRPIDPPLPRNHR